MNPITIVSCVTNDLTTDQRVHRSAQFLHNKGYKVTLYGRQLSNSKIIQRDYTTTRSKLWFTKGALFYANYNFRLFFKLLTLKPDVVLANDLDTLLAAYWYSKITGNKIVFDSHEYFPEVPELVNRPRVKKIWLSIEKRIVPNLKHCLTVSPAIVDLFKELYNTDFHLLRNLPTQKATFTGNKAKARAILNLPTDKGIIIYQGALNVGRGLELAIEAMQFLDNTLLLIAGSGDIESQLKEKVTALSISDKVIFTGALSPEELSKYTQIADIGFSLEEDLGLNYRFALPNKLFDYVQARIPVLVSNLPVMKEVVRTNNVGMVFSGNRNAQNLADQFSTLLEESKNGTWNKAIEIAAKELTWENEQKVLFNVIEKAIRN